MGCSWICEGSRRYLALLVLALSPALGQGETARVPSVGVELSAATVVVDNISARAAADANAAVLDAAARLRLSIEALQYSDEHIFDKRPKDLNAAQRKTLEGIQSGVTSLQAAAGLPRDQARDATDDIRRLTQELSPAPAQPVVVGTSPPILVPSAADAVFVVTGRRLSKADPRLLFGEAEAMRTSLTDEEARFSLPASALQSSDRVALRYSGRVLLSDRSCSWLLSCRKASRSYPVSVVMLPTRLATVRIGFDRKKTEKIYDQVPAAQPPAGQPPTAQPPMPQPPATEGAPAAASGDMIYRRRFEYSTEDLTVMSCTRESQAPHAAGYSIDTATLAGNVIDHGGETRWSIQDASANGFTVELCAQPQIDRMGKTAGAIAVELTWKEYRLGEVISPREWLQPETLAWGAEIKESLPADTNEVRVELDYFDGTHASFADTSSDRYVQTKWDAQTHQLLVTPRLRSGLEDSE